jgi:O-antigen/teichoic acid export membrane protein
MKRGEIAHSVSRGGFYITLEQLSVLLSGLVYSIVVLRWLGPYAYGVLALALAIAGLATIGAGNFEAYLERYAAEYQARGEFATLVRAHRLALGLKLALAAVSGAVMWALAGWLAHHFGLNDLLVLLPALLPLVLSDAFSTTARATLFGMQRFGSMALVGLLFHAAKILMVLVLWSMGRGVLALALGLGLLTLAQGLLATLVPLWYLRGPARGQTAPASRTLLKPMLAYCTPLLGARIAFLSGQNLSKVVLGKLFDPEQLGYFTFAFQTVDRFVALLYSLPYALLPPLTKLVTMGDRDRLRWVFGQAFRLISAAAALLSAAILLFAPELTRWLAGPRFEAAAPLLRVMALVPWVRTAQQPLTMLLQALRRPGSVFALALLRFAVEFGGYFALIPVLGTPGAAWAHWAGAAVSFLAALAWTDVLLPEGRGERWRHYGLTTVLLAPLVLAGLWIDAEASGALAFAIKLLLVPLGLLGVFALRLITAHDLEKVQGLKLGDGWPGRLRDHAVRGGYSLLRVTSVREVR